MSRLLIAWMAMGSISVSRRMMQGTYNEKGDRWVARILSVRETCRLRGVPTFPVLVDAVTCYCIDQPPDVAWI